ncbi:ribosomal protein S18-alanine N-acetyltransferase [uncultured Agrococcus sp.]|uniref:ribosomal protein S18-alanine N-acetyltransferase n=1 Tax=uncultured Agrococcus sp. TaxID=382258 RepID=UPI0025CFB3C5|nr:ribosomal protein S18-alanine N-acetyltransferase [uncultured Agrococcus sp.]
MSLRAAEVTDLEAIMGIETAIFANDAWNSKTMKSELKSRANRYVVLTEDDRIVGYGGARIVGCESDIQTIAITEGYRGKGEGRKLMEALMNAARAEGALQMFLEVRADNPVAVTLYESLGFEKIDVRHGYYQPDGVDAIVMMKEPL